jgi:hypothetical protein
MSLTFIVDYSTWQTETDISFSIVMIVDNDINVLNDLQNIVLIILK